MTKTLLCTAAALALSFAGAAAAQNAAPNDAAPAAATPPTSAPNAAGEDAADPTKGLKAGMAVVDPAGQQVGTINRIGRTADGTAAVELSVDGGKSLTIALNALTPAGDHATIQATKAQVQQVAR